MFVQRENLGKDSTWPWHHTAPKVLDIRQCCENNLTQLIKNNMKEKNENSSLNVNYIAWTEFLSVRLFSDLFTRKTFGGKIYRNIVYPSPWQPWKVVWNQPPKGSCQPGTPEVKVIYITSVLEQFCATDSNSNILNWSHAILDQTDYFDGELIIQNKYGKIKHKCKADLCISEVESHMLQGHIELVQWWNQS